MQFTFGTKLLVICKKGFLSIFEKFDDWLRLQVIVQLRCIPNSVYLAQRDQELLLLRLDARPLQATSPTPSPHLSFCQVSSDSSLELIYSPGLREALEVKVF